MQTTGTQAQRRAFGRDGVEEIAIALTTAEPFYKRDVKGAIEHAQKGGLAIHFAGLTAWHMAQQLTQMFGGPPKRDSPQVFQGKPFAHVMHEHAGLLRRLAKALGVKKVFIHREKASAGSMWTSAARRCAS